MKIEQRLSNISLIIGLAIVGSSSPALAQSSYTPGTPFQFGHVHKPYGEDSDQQPSFPTPIPYGSSSSSGAAVTPAPSYSSPSPSNSSTSTSTPASGQSASASPNYATPPSKATTQKHSSSAKHPTVSSKSSPTNYSTPASNSSSSSYTTQSINSPAPTYSTALTSSPPSSAQAAPQEAPEQTAVQEPSQESASQQSSQAHQMGNVLRRVGKALQGSGVANNLGYRNNLGYTNNVGIPGVPVNVGIPGVPVNLGYPASGAAIGALSRNFSGKPTLVNGVPYTGGALPPGQSAAPKFQISSLKDDFPLPVGQDDLETFDNKQLSQRANGGWVQRHFQVGTEGGGIIGRHGPQWHVGGQN